jgi:hypothetical protein
MEVLKMKILQMKELPYDAYSSLVEIFGGETIQQLRKDFKDNCLGLAREIKNTFNSQDYLAEVITFKNGNAFSDGGIRVTSNQDTVYTHHAIVLMGEWTIDLLHSDNIIKTKDYIVELQKYNPKLRIDYTLSTGWYTQDGYPYKPSLEDLKKYKY